MTCINTMILKIRGVMNIRIKYLETIDKEADGETHGYTLYSNRFKIGTMHVTKKRSVLFNFDSTRVLSRTDLEEISALSKHFGGKI